MEARSLMEDGSIGLYHLMYSISWLRSHNFFIFIQVQTIVREIPIMPIAYGASSQTLSDRKAYPFFLRPNPSDTKKTEYMAQLLEQLRERGNEINAVNIIYSDSLYGRDSHKGG